MANHDYNFEYGDILSKMGAAWYISYAYHQHFDTSHDNYQRVSTWSNRVSKYNANRNLEKYFIGKIATMSASKLSANTIGLSGVTVLRMAQDLLKRL